MNFDFNAAIDKMIKEAQQPSAEERIAALEQAIADLALLFTINN